MFSIDNTHTSNLKKKANIFAKLSIDIQISLSITLSEELLEYVEYRLVCLPQVTSHPLVILINPTYKSRYVKIFNIISIFINNKLKKLPDRKCQETCNCEHML